MNYFSKFSLLSKEGVRGRSIKTPSRPSPYQGKEIKEMTQIYNKKEQKNTRKYLRKLPVGCEIKLWSGIRQKQLGYKFRRQFGIGKYIVDFYCPELKLAIEIDGATHCTDKEIEHDKIRQAYIESLGIKIIRYSNIDIKESIV